MKLPDNIVPVPLRHSSMAAKDKMMKSTNRVSKTARRSLRTRVAAGFHKYARGVDKHTAHRRTLDFYRSSGAAWAQRLY